MLWPFLTFVGFAGLAVVWWIGRLNFFRAREAGRAALDKLREEQRLASTQLQAQQEALFNSMVEGLLVLDERGRILLANRAFTELFGVTADIRSRTIIEAVRLHELAEVVEFLGTQKQVLGMELKLSRPSERWLEINGAAIFNADDQRQGTILVLHDLTRLKRLENTRKEFVANVSHELRTPLSLIQGYVETLLEGAKDNPEVASKFLHTIDRNAERLRLLIEDLLVISELESGRVRLDIQPMPVRPVVQKVLDDFKARADAKEVELCNRSPDLTVRADPGRLEQVLGNLVDNAIKYGRSKGHVIVGGRAAEGGLVEVFVQDDGPGIAEDDLPRLFERFYRVDKARSREQGGTGLGLSIVKHIVQSHSGRVWARSEPGRGSSFFFTLPQEVGTGS